MKTPTANERKALGAFLVEARRRLRPSDFGLPTGLRRTSGLRREEVATLAGISVSWYTSLEQGRDIRVSATTLRRLAQVLQLDRAETEYLLALSSHQPAIVATSTELSDGLLDLVQAVNPIPSYIRNDRLDILAWNNAVAALFVDYGTLAQSQRNTLYLMFLHPLYRSLILEWETVARGTVALFRANRAKATDKSPFDLLVDVVSAESEEFRRWWATSDVQGFYEGHKQLRHPQRGALDLTYVALSPELQPDLSFVTYVERAAPR